MAMACVPYHVYIGIYAATCTSSEAIRGRIKDRRLTAGSVLGQAQKVAQLAAEHIQVQLAEAAAAEKRSQAEQLAGKQAQRLREQSAELRALRSRINAAQARAMGWRSHVLVQKQNQASTPVPAQLLACATFDLLTGPTETVQGV